MKLSVDVERDVETAEFEAVHREPARQEEGPARLTVADALFLLVALLAAWPRFANLGDVPLSPLEAAGALSNWQFWQPGNPLLAIDSPAYFTLTALLMPFLGDGDAVMRLVPALFGWGAVLLPWLLRARLGNVGALAASLLLAASPLGIAVSRTAGGDAIALFAVLATAVALLRITGDSNERWLYALAASLGLGFASAPLFYSGLVTLAAAWLLLAAIGPSFPPGQAIFPLIRARWRPLLIYGGGLFLLLSTAFFMYLPGLGAATRLPVDWLGQFTLDGGLPALLAPFQVLGRYELLLLLLGMVAVLWAIWRNRPSGSLFVYWSLAALLLLLLQRGELSNVLLVTLPGFLLLGLFTDHLLAPSVNKLGWWLAAGLLVSGAVVVANTARYSRVVLFEPQQIGYIWIALMAVVAATFAIYFVWMADERAAGQGVWLALLILLLTFQWGSGWRLGYAAANDPRERWVGAATASDVRVFSDILATISSQVSNSDSDIDIFSTADSPVLRWYLRDYRRAQFGETLPPNTQSSIVITPQGVEPKLGSGYLGTDFGLLLEAPAERPPSETPLMDGVRWWLFRETTAVPQKQGIILWVRSDLVQSE